MKCLRYSFTSNVSTTAFMYWVVKKGNFDWAWRLQSEMRRRQVHLLGSIEGLPLLAYSRCGVVYTQTSTLQNFISTPSRTVVGQVCLIFQARWPGSREMGRSFKTTGRHLTRPIAIPT
ncbi:hypothetical protein FCM35_KLT02008 [Carex littledalei]|uniref:Uncharacterized protein n=1 Tax=Carex littledalei TaxID=544730 RepID=A0A833R324_9POAL|nr:hypothetical protein FCM35_KLT02008 [Carex littledalei]